MEPNGGEGVPHMGLLGGLSNADRLLGRPLGHQCSWQARAGLTGGRPPHERCRSSIPSQHGVEVVAQVQPIGVQLWVATS